MSAELELTRPLLLLLGLLALPAFYMACSRGGGSLVYSSLRTLPSSGASWRTALAWIPDLLLALAIVSLSIALAGPRRGDKESRIKSEGIAIAMVIDISGSMRALDLAEGDQRVTRLDAVKKVFEDFVNGSQDGSAKLPGRPDDAIAVISFAGYADTRCPLTLDKQMVTRIARDLEIVSEPSEDGTALGDGLGLAVERLRRAKANSKVAILLTDGVQNRGIESPKAAAELARVDNIKVYTIGAGTNGMARMEVQNPFTGRAELRSVPVEIDEDTLRSVAELTGGAYFRATDADSLRSVYAEIDKLERSELDETRFLEYHLYFGHFVLLALLLMCLGWLGRATIWRRLP